MVALADKAWCCGYLENTEREWSWFRRIIFCGVGFTTLGAKMYVPVTALRSDQTISEGMSEVSLARQRGLLRYVVNSAFDKRKKKWIKKSNYSRVTVAQSAAQ